MRIETLTTIEQFHECETLQGRVWGLTDTDVVPLHLLITIQQNGGLLLGAFDGQGRMIGFLLGFLGARGGDVTRPKHCSHMMGVLDEWRGRGVGYRLKLAQREHALSQGLDLVTWTYDPLESLNAALNIGKLGAVCDTYVRDLYGPMTDELNAGLATDRFQVDWWIRSERVAGRVEGGRPRRGLDEILGASDTILNPAARRADGLLEPCGETRLPGTRRVAVEVPAHARGIKDADLDLASRWRDQTRYLFEGCFAAGYAATEFVSEVTSEDRRSYYVLERQVEGT